MLVMQTYDEWIRDLKACVAGTSREGDVDFALARLNDWADSFSQDDLLAASQVFRVAAELGLDKRKFLEWDRAGTWIRPRPHAKRYFDVDRGGFPYRKCIRPLPGQPGEFESFGGVRQTRTKTWTAETTAGIRARVTGHPTCESAIEALERIWGRVDVSPPARFPTTGGHQQ